MSSTAKSAQGSTLYIGELDADSPDAATVSGITKAVNPVVTATAHGLPEGSIVLFASVGGMTEINGKYACVGVIDANSFYAYGIDSTDYTTYTSSGTATTKRVALGNWKSWNGFAGSRSDLDATNLASTAMEYIGGLQDNGDFSFEYQVDDTDAGQQAFLANRAAPGINSAFKLTFANAKYRSWRGYIKSMGETGAVNSIINGSGSMKISGNVTRG